DLEKPVITYAGKENYTLDEISSLKLSSLFSGFDEVDGVTSLTLNINSITTSGRHVIKARTFDKSGNESSIDYPVYVDYSIKNASDLTNTIDLSNNASSHKLPSTGEIHVPVILVDLVGFNNRVEINDTYINKIKEAFNGNNSVSSFYKISSYNKLNLIFDIYEKPLEYNITEKIMNNDAYYSFLQNIVKASGNNNDFTIYDQNNDSYLDAAWIIYNVPYKSGGRLWAYVSDYETNIVVSPKALKMTNIGFASYDFVNPYSSYNKNLGLTGDIIPNTYIHETGHMLGLKDHYDTTKSLYKDKLNKTYGLDVMDFNKYDITACEKIILNWLDPMIIENNQTINISSVEEGSAIVLKLNFDNDLYSKYLVVEFISGTKNNNGLIRGIRVNLVNFVLDETTGTFKYENTGDGEVLIKTISNKNPYYLDNVNLYDSSNIFFAKGDEFVYNSEWSNHISFKVLDITDTYANLRFKF
ncbi:MAG: hypothetical protein K6G28_02630, partial [Acholeplasmatales bacterium]|nr:hypothetical protein [Acholeplasmatales bacterium]